MLRITSPVERLLPRQPNQSLIDGLRVLQFAMTRGGIVGVSMVAEEMGMEVTRAHRFLRTLAAAGYLRQVKGRKYAIGPAVPVLAAQAMHGSGFVEHAFPVLEELHESTGMLVAYGLLWGRFVTYLYHAAPEVHGGRALVGHPVLDAAGSRLGWAMLAALDEAAIRALYFKHKIPEFRTIDRLLARLRAIRTDGFVYGMTNEQGDHTVAIHLENNPSAAIGIAGRIPRSDADGWVQRLRETARLIEKA
jgi:DNA-binding IclR family transcriptional regulator